MVGGSGRVRIGNNSGRVRIGSNSGRVRIGSNSGRVRVVATVLIEWGTLGRIESVCYQRVCE